MFSWCDVLVFYVVFVSVIYILRPLVEYFTSTHGRRSEVVTQQLRNASAEPSTSLVPLDYHGSAGTSQCQENPHFSCIHGLENRSNDVHERPHISPRTLDYLSRAIFSPEVYHDEVLSPSEKNTVSDSPRDSHQREARPIRRKPRVNYTPFLTACWDCDVLVMEDLIDKGDDPCQTSSAGETGLYLCIYRMAKGKKSWNPECLQLLVDNGCSVNAQTNENNTALHVAVKNEHLPSITWLINHGANSEIMNVFGWRPTSIAAVMGRKDISILLWRKRFLEETETPRLPLQRHSQNKSARRCLFPENK